MDICACWQIMHIGFDQIHVNTCQYNQARSQVLCWGGGGGGGCKVWFSGFKGTPFVRHGE